MQRLRDTFRRKQNTLEAQAKAEASKQQKAQQSQQQPQYGGLGGTSNSSRTSLLLTPTHGPQSQHSDDYWPGDPSPPLSPARNETSLSFSSNQSQDDVDEEEEVDDFDTESIYRQAQFSAWNLCTPIDYSKKSCLEVPVATAIVFDADSNVGGGGKQIRSASFDETRSRELYPGSRQSNSAMAKDGCSNLDVPDGNFRNLRSRSFDYATIKERNISNQGTTTATGSGKQIGRTGRADSTTSGPSSFLDVPKWKLLIRRSSSGSHSSSSTAATDSSVKDCLHCVLLSQQQTLLAADSIESNLTPPESVDSECSSFNEEEECDSTLVGSPSSALSANEDNNNIGSPLHVTKTPELSEAVDEFEIDEFIEPIEGLPIVTLCPPEADSPLIEETDDGSGITVISLEVPVLFGSKQSRSASVDSPYLLQVPKRTDIEVREGPPKARSKSVDIVLPTNPGGPYLIVPPLRQPTPTTK